MKLRAAVEKEATQEKKEDVFSPDPKELGMDDKTGKRNVFRLRITMEDFRNAMHNVRVALEKVFGIDPSSAVHSGR